MKTLQPLIINFVPTGMVPTKDKTPHVPITPTEIIEQTHEAFEIGITMVHLHARLEDGTPTYKVSYYNEILDGIKKHCPELVTCASLSGRNFPEVEKRTEVLELKPDMGSLTLSSLNFATQASVNSPETILKLIDIMDSNGVKPELECFDAGMINYAKYLKHKNLIQPPFYFNLFGGNISSTQADMSYVGLMIRDLPSDSYWSLAGIGKDQLRMNTLAIAYGGGVRVGLEDNIWYDIQRKKLASNIELIKRIHALTGIFEREVMTSKEFGNLGFYNSSRVSLLH